MQKIKSSINTGHIITIAIFLIATGVSGITTYYTVKFTGQNNTIQIQQLNQKVQETNNKIGHLDDIYVRQKQFDQFKNNNNDKLDEINKNLNYLIRLQIKKAQR